MSDKLEVDSAVINEICYIYNRRNELNRIRTALRAKLYYWRIVKKTSKLSKSEVKMNRLKLSGELLCVKAEIMKHTKDTRPRLKELRKSLINGFRPIYNNGYVDLILLRKYKTIDGRDLIKINAEKFAMDLAVEKLLISEEV